LVAIDARSVTGVRDKRVDRRDTARQRKPDAAVIAGQKPTSVPAQPALERAVCDAGNRHDVEERPIGQIALRDEHQRAELFVHAVVGTFRLQIP